MRTSECTMRLGVLRFSFGVDIVSRLQCDQIISGTATIYFHQDGMKSTILPLLAPAANISIPVCITTISFSHEAFAALF